MLADGWTIGCDAENLPPGKKQTNGTTPEIHQSQEADAR